MQPVLEDMFMGPMASPSLSQELQFRWENSRRRVRVIFAGQTIADSTHVMWLLEYGRLPVYYFPLEDVRQEFIEATDHHTHSPLKGEASYWTIHVGDRVAQNAAWSYLSPLPAGPQVKGYVAFYWNTMGAWYEEDEQVYAHARDPYKGKASYWSTRIGAKDFRDSVWSYREPLPACTPIDGLLCFFNERVDAIYVDDELVPKPITPWSE